MRLASRITAPSPGLQAVVVAPASCSASQRSISLIGGTLFLMWLGEQITSRGIGNGASLIIMAGIVAQLPVTLSNLFESRPHRLAFGSGRSSRAILIGLVLVAFICFMERAQRRVLIQYPKRQTARRA